MLGDAHDLAQVLAWAKMRFWTGMEDPDEDDNMLEWPFPQGVRLEVVESLVDLCRCFDGAEMSHRRESKLTGNKGEVKVRLRTLRVSVLFDRWFHRNLCRVQFGSCVSPL
jgi:hypothetical protein